MERIGLKSTHLRSVNGELLVISNTNLLSKEITNYAHLHRRRVQFAIGVVYQTTPEMLRALPALLEAQGALPRDGTLLLIGEALGRKDWAGARALTARMVEEGNFSFLAPIVQSWISLGQRR